MEEKEIDDLEAAAETIEQLQYPARDETENPKKKEASSDPDRFLSEIVSMFDSDPAAEATAGKTVKKRKFTAKRIRILPEESFTTRPLLRQEPRETGVLLRTPARSW